MNEKFEAFDEEYRTRLLNRLDKRARSFMSLFRGTMIFAFAFPAFILIPLVGLQHDEYKYNTAIKKQTRNKIELAKFQQDVSVIEKQLRSLPDQLKELKDDADEKEKEIKKINEKLEQIQLQIDKNTSQTGKFEEDARDMSNILERFQSLPKYDTQRNVEKLRESLLQLERYFDHPSGQELDDPCFSADMNIFVRCKVKTIIRAELEKYQRIIGDADYLLSGYVVLDGEKQIEARINQVLTGLDKLMHENPQFWHTIRGKIFFFAEFEAPMQGVLQEVDQQIHRYMKALDFQKQKIIADRKRLKEEGDHLEKELSAKQKLQEGTYKEISELDQKIKVLKVDKSALNTKLIATQNAATALKAKIMQMQGFINKITSAKADLEKRLQKIQSPFGTLPVGLSEAVLVFPVALATMIILYFLALADMIQLRMEYHQATISRYPMDGQKIQSHISILAPVWLDPIDDRSVNKWRHMLMLNLPVLAYMIALLLILYSWYIEQPQPGSMPLIRVGYSAVYVLGLFSFVLSGLRIYREWSYYKKEGSRLVERPFSEHF